MVKVIGVNNLTPFVSQSRFRNDFDPEQSESDGGEEVVMGHRARHCYDCHPTCRIGDVPRPHRRTRLGAR